MSVVAFACSFDTMMLLCCCELLLRAAGNVRVVLLLTCIFNDNVHKVIFLNLIT
jgi:hypothetical protein